MEKVYCAQSFSNTQIFILRMPLIILVLLLLLQQHIEGTNISWRNIDDGFTEAKKKNLPAVVVIHKSWSLASRKVQNILKTTLVLSYHTHKLFYQTVISTN
tara:strand:- start:140 stop:442 length:303 start_codon:yes stop_codon:yes gene_type:complete